MDSNTPGGFPALGPELHDFQELHDFSGLTDYPLPAGIQAAFNSVLPPAGSTQQQQQQQQQQPQQGQFTNQNTPTPTIGVPYSSSSVNASSSASPVLHGTPMGQVVGVQQGQWNQGIPPLGSQVGQQNYQQPILPSQHSPAPPQSLQIFQPSQAYFPQSNQPIIYPPQSTEPQQPQRSILWGLQQELKKAREQCDEKLKIELEKLKGRWKAANAANGAVLVGQSLPPSSLTAPASAPLASSPAEIHAEQAVYIPSSPAAATYVTVATSSSSFFKIPELNDDEYPVLLPMVEYQREVYLSKIEECMQALDHYLNSPDRENPDIGEPVFNLVERLVKVGSHPKLAQDEDEEEGNTEELWEWSSKLAFLRELIDKVVDENIKIGIVAQNEASINLLELLCRSLKVTYRRMDRVTLLPEVKDERGMIQVYLVPSDSAGAVGAACQLVIALDGSWEPNNYTVKQLRANPFDPNKQAPVIRLITINAIDHILLSLDPAVPGSQSLYYMAQSIKGLGDNAGVLPESLDTFVNSVDAVSSWIATRCESEYPLPTKLPCIAEFEIHTLVEAEAPEATSRKRLPSPDIDDPRKRLQLDNGDNGHVNMEDTSAHVADDEAMEDPTEAPHADVEEAEGEVAMDLDATDTESEPDIFRHRPKAATPVIRPLDSIPPEKQTPAELLSSYKLLITQTQTIEAVHAQYKSWGSRLQSAYESQRSEIASLKAELTKLKTETEGVRNQGKRDRETNTVLRGEINQLTVTLRDAEPVLSKEVQDLKKKLNNLKGMEKEAEFAREQYQNCSAAAAEMRRELDRLSTENEELKRRADFRVVELRKLGEERATEMWEEEKRKLKEMIKEREDRIQRLENREASVVKRSVGRRVGSPAYGSRGNSPAIGGRERREL